MRRWLSVLEKGKRQIDENDWMTAYEIEGHPDLHISHHYFRGLTMPQVAQLKQTIRNHFANHPLKDTRVSLNQEEMFGPDKDIRVLVNDGLVPHLDPELKEKLQQIAPSKFSYRPHISTDDLPHVTGKIKRYYLQQGNGKTHLVIDAAQGQDKIETQPQPIIPKEGKTGPMSKTVNAKVEGIEVKRPMTGVAMQQTGVKTSAPVSAVAPSVPVPPKPSATTGKMNNAPTQPMQKAAPVMPMGVQPQKPPQQQKQVETIDYSKFQRPQYSSTGSVPPIHKPLQHSKGAMQGMTKADKDSPKFERCVMDVKEKNKEEGLSQEERNPWAICHASLDKTDETASLEKLRKLRKCMAKSMPVYMRD